MEQSMAMKVVIFGASGGTGQEIVQLALHAGHRVRAVARTPSKIAFNDAGLEVYKADIYDEEAVWSALAGQEVVVSAVSPGSFSLTQPTDVFSRSAQALVTGMYKHGIRRLVVISTQARSYLSMDNHPIFEFVIKPLFWRTLYSDVVKMDEIIAGSTLDWTLVRPPRVINHSPTGSYRVGEGMYALPGGASIGRADMAGYIVSILDEPRLFAKNVALAY
jgi:putative NADH-flavin reductase